MDVTPKLETLGEGEYSFYISGTPPKSPLITKYINNTVFCKSSDAAKVRSLLKNLNGESITLNSVKTDVLKKLNYQKTFVNSFGQFGYSTRAQALVRVNGKKVNLQVVIKDGKTIVGFPVILGSY